MWIRALQPDPLILPINTAPSDGAMLRGGFPVDAKTNMNYAVYVSATSIGIGSVDSERHASISLWDGSLFSAEDYFLHANDTPGNITPKPRSNVNHFGFSVGGPIRKNKLFFFTAYEGVRIALPIV